MDTILELKDIAKIYPNGTVANRSINVRVQRQTVHAIVGENGAGKSTLMKIIFGLEPPTSGSLLFMGEEVFFASPNDAIKKGIGMVHQHFMLAPDLTVAENIVLGMEPRKAGLFLDMKEALRETERISKEYGLDVPVRDKVKDLSVGLKQRVEILKALCRNAALLILDEPTAVLTPQETAVLFKTLALLKEKGKTILFISHKLNEVKAIADSITVMKDGRVVTTEAAADVSEEKIAELMVGRALDARRAPTRAAIGAEHLSVRGLGYLNADGFPVLSDVSFNIRGGEVLGLAGVEGNGQSELIAIMTGLLRPTSGEVTLDGAPITRLSPRQIRERGLSHIPEDRMDDGMAAAISIEENLIADRYFKPGFSRAGWIDRKNVLHHAEKLIRDFKVLASSPKVPMKSLSGGNIQKAIVARELSSDHDFILAAQPTRGVDVGSEEMIHDLILKARDAGKAIFLVSADLDEILKLSTRIIVVFRGRIVAHFPDSSIITEIDLGPYMLGAKAEEGAHGEVPA
jgi:simple sugar transport system ATP-binding protein